jgi:aspartate carbamoyltransferase catalytic subunit
MKKLIPEAVVQRAKTRSNLPTRLSSRHLLGLEGMPVGELELVFDTAETMLGVLDRPIKKVPPLRGLTVVNLFYEPSTRTRFSFELAEKRLSADTVSFSASGSSVSKGESLVDTVRNIEAMKTDMVVIRHASSGAPHKLAREVDSPVINAGDGQHEHPTQGLLDILTLRRTFGRTDGLVVAIVGDILHSRVARSDIWGLRTLGAEVRLCGPSTLMPVEIEKMGVRVFHDLDLALEGAHAVNVLRLQRERQQAGLLPSLREYSRLWGITRERLERMHPDYVVMHPGPINRGVEIAPDVADGPRSVILPQVTHGVAVRMAVLYLLAGGGEHVPA